MWRGNPSSPRQARYRRMRRPYSLGGYGNTSLPLARRLLAEADHHRILPGRSPDKVERVAAELNARFPGGRVTGDTSPPRWDGSSIGTRQA